MPRDGVSFRTCEGCGRDFKTASSQRMYLCYACSHHGPAGSDKKPRDDEDTNPFADDPNRVPDEEP